MKIDRSCNTCEFFADNCCEDQGFMQIDDVSSPKECWSIKRDYLLDLLEHVPDSLKLEFLHNPFTKVTFDDILNYLEKLQDNLDR